MKQKIVIGGVPEHFNIPWYYGTSQGWYNETGWDVEWKSYPGGTGAMLQDLKDEKLDVATLLTEGAVSGILDGVNAKIMKFYVDSPLIWGIHIKNGRELNLHHLEDKKFAISRYKSGSHLMPYVLATQKNNQLDDEKNFVIVKNLDGARESIAKEETDIFLWEKFITQPFVDNGEFDRVGSCPTPWPSFVIVARNEIIENNYDSLNLLFHQLHLVTKNLINSGDIIQMVADEFGLSYLKAVRWYAEIEWNNELGVDTEKLASVVNRLSQLGLIKFDDLDETILKLVDRRSII